MKTKDFIKMLQDADPDGEGHVRMSGGIPTFAEAKPGYYDGPYTYIDDDGNYVYSTKGYKVDVFCQEIEEFVEDLVSHKDVKWEDIESKFKFELTYSMPEQRKQREDVIINSAKKFYHEMIDIHTRSFDRGLKEMLENAEKGWKWYQNKLVDSEDIKERAMHHHYTWKIFDENGKSQGSNIWMTQSVKESGKWERLDNNEIEGYYQWILIK